MADQDDLIRHLATRTVPIVFMLGNDPVGSGLVDSLARLAARSVQPIIMGYLRQQLAGGEATVDLGALQMVTGLTCSSHAPPIKSANAYAVLNENFSYKPMFPHAHSASNGIFRAAK
jgi:hypothetical protein